MYPRLHFLVLLSLFFSPAFDSSASCLLHDEISIVCILIIEFTPQSPPILPFFTQVNKPADLFPRSFLGYIHTYMNTYRCPGCFPGEIFERRRDWHDSQEERVVHQEPRVLRRAHVPQSKRNSERGNRRAKFSTEVNVLYRQ